MNGVWHHRSPGKQMSSTTRRHDSFAPRTGKISKPDNSKWSRSPRVRLAGTGPTRRHVGVNFTSAGARCWRRGDCRRVAAPAPPAQPGRRRGRVNAHGGAPRRCRPAGRVGVSKARSGPRKGQTAKCAGAFCGSETGPRGAAVAGSGPGLLPVGTGVSAGTGQTLHLNGRIHLPKPGAVCP